MGELWYPLAIRHEGAHAHYEAGRNSMVSVVCHYTVGVNSIGTLGRDFTFLVDRDGDVHQGAPVDAKVWHAGEPWNSRGPGIEVEYHPAYDDVDGDGPEDSEIMTVAQVRSLNLLVLWLHQEHGVPLVYHDGPRLADWNGFIAHRAVIQTGAWHSDFWPEIYAALIFFGLPPTPAHESQRNYEVFKMHSPSRAAVVTESEVYTCGFGGTMDFIEVDEGVFDFIVADVRAKRVESLAALHAQRDVRLV